MDATEIFRQKLKLRTDRKNPRQSTIADACGITRSEMNDFLNGRRNFSLERMEKIALFLKTTFTKMVSDSDISKDADVERASDPIGKKPNVIQLQHFEIVKEFKNKGLAKDANRALLNIERLNQEMFEKLVAHIQSVEWSLKMAAEKMPLYGDRRSGTDRRSKHAHNDIPGGADRRSGRNRRKTGT